MSTTDTKTTVDALRSYALYFESTDAPIRTIVLRAADMLEKRSEALQLVILALSEDEEGWQEQLTIARAALGDPS